MPEAYPRGDAPITQSLFYNQKAQATKKLPVNQPKQESPQGRENAGGGIANHGQMTIIDSIITGNSAGRGAGLYVGEGSTVTIKNTLISGNSAPQGRDIATGAAAVVVTEAGVGGTTVVTALPRVLRTAAAPAPVGPYNQGIRAAGTMIFTAGQIPLDPTTGCLVGGGDIAAQTEQVFQNLAAVLAAGGATFADVVKTTVYLLDLEDFAAMNQVYARYFPIETAPARVCIQAARLPKEARVEIDCIAVLGS